MITIGLDDKEPRVILHITLDDGGSLTQYMPIQTAEYMIAMLQTSVNELKRLEETGDV